MAIAAAAGNNARVYGLDTGILAEGLAADIVLIDACDGGSTDDALAGISNGDVPAVAAVISDGVPPLRGPLAQHARRDAQRARAQRSRLVQDFSGAAPRARPRPMRAGRPARTSPFEDKGLR